MTRWRMSSTGTAVAAGQAAMMIVLAAGAERAVAGGLLLPGAGAVSTARAGAAVASADDGEALVINPAGIAKSRGNTITLSAAMFRYAMEFQRRGTYDAVGGEDYPYEGQPYELVKNDADVPFGFAGIQPVPVVAFLTDLGGRVPGLHLGIGVYTPNAYPFRGMCAERAGGCERYVFDPGGDFAEAPLSTRYDIIEQDALLFLPSIAAAYRVLPALDVGLRLSAGRATVKDTTALWATLDGNVAENPAADGVLTVDATDGFVPAFGLGVTYRPTPAIEIGAAYASALDVHARGTGISQLGPSAGLPGVDVQILPVADDDARCAPGGTAEELKACVDLQIPMSVQVGGRYVFLDAAGRPKGDVELDLGWEHWGKRCEAGALLDGSCTSPSDFRVVVDATTAIVPPIGPPLPVAALNDGIVRHGLQDTYSVRLGGSYRIPVGAVRDGGASNELILRGGVGYDTAAAKAGWLRADLDGAARTTLTVGGSYRTDRLEVSLGGGAILEGSPSNPNNGGGAEPCNPEDGDDGCPGDDRVGPDPINPILSPGNQVESPVTQGDYRSHYLVFMLGVSTWF